jgi:hypothetical protein
MQSAIEHVTLGNDQSSRGAAVCTNVFLRTPHGWRMVMHHASPAPDVTPAENSGPLHLKGKRRRSERLPRPYALLSHDRVVVCAQRQPAGDHAPVEVAVKRGNAPFARHL